MARKTAESQVAANMRSGLRRPKAPENLNSEAAEHWRKIVGSKSIDFFNDVNLALLANYCSTLVNLRRASDVLEVIDERDIEGFGDQVKTVSKLQNLALATASKLRLTIQSTIRGDAGINKETESETKRSSLWRIMT